VKTSSISTRVVRCGTGQADVVGRILKAGPMQVEFDNGQLRYLKVHGVEVLRAIGFLVRDENWGTYIPDITGLKISENKKGFSMRFHAVCKRPGQEISYDALIEGHANGSLEFSGTAVPKTDFLTARTGFVVLHPLKGVAGEPVVAEHVDGSVDNSRFPPLINPVQPFLNLRSLSHEVLPGLTATVCMEGDTFETEDHRNWTDASFKTYVRPLALPWPYTLKAGEPVRQSVKLTLSGTGKASHSARPGAGITVTLGKTSRQKLLPVGFGVPAAEVTHAVQHLDLVKRAGPRILQCHFDPREHHGLKELYGYRVLAEATGAEVVLEIIVVGVETYKQELATIAAMTTQAGLKLSAVAVCPEGDLKSVLPGGERPPAAPLEKLYKATREAFPGIKVGGGMFSFFTELNRKRPPAGLLDFAMNSTCPIVHAADDRSVMETLEALPYQVRTARTFLGKTPHRVGPSAIGCRDNPHGATFSPNPDNERICLVNADPRMRGLFGAAWLLGYIASFARSGIQALTIGAPTGPLGVIYRKTQDRQPYYDALNGPAVFPGFHVVTGLMNSAGQNLVDATSSDEQKVCCLAHRGKNGTALWVANLTAENQNVKIKAGKGPIVGTILDETSFRTATTKPLVFQQSWKPMRSSISMKPYAVAIISIGD
jgi:D-apionolactonase